MQTSFTVCTINVLKLASPTIVILQQEICCAIVEGKSKLMCAGACKGRWKEVDQMKTTIMKCNALRLARLVFKGVLKRHCPSHCAMRPLSYSGAIPYTSSVPASLSSNSTTLATFILSMDVCSRNVRNLLDLSS
jgi:hypothetical protein